MTIRPILKPLVSGVALFASLNPGSAGAALVLTGDYDPAGGNDVDQSGTFASGTGGATVANTINLASFKTLVAAAFAAGTGGVMGADQVGDTVSSTSMTSSAFGPGGANTLTIASGGATTFAISPAQSNSRVPTSGSSQISTPAGGAFDLGSFTLNGGVAGQGVTHLGVTLIHRQRAQSWVASATFSGGGTVTYSPVAFAVADSASTEDTFFGFVAPVGQTITSVLVTSGAEFAAFDDIGFITNVVPEPSGLMLLGAGLGLASLRRRRS